MIVVEPSVRARFGRSAFTRRGLEAFLAEARQATGLAGSISVLLAGDEEIQRLNREFRSKDKPTDVLSFPAGQGAGRGRMAGDLAISLDTAARQADEQGHSLDTELRVLLLHGILHLAGYDHEKDAGEMAHKENALRRKLGLAEGLIARAGANGAKRGRKR